MTKFWTAFPWTIEYGAPKLKSKNSFNVGTSGHDFFMLWKIMESKKIILNNFMWYDIILCYTLYCAIQYYIILYHTILYYSIVYYTILYYSILNYSILYYNILYYTILYNTILSYTKLYWSLLSVPVDWSCPFDEFDKP